MPYKKNSLTIQNPLGISAKQQNDTVFKPNRRMKVWLAAAEELGPQASISSISRSVRIPRDAWYKWLHKPGFIEWYEARWQIILMIYRAKLDAIGMKYASEGRYDFWLAMQKRVGNIEPEIKKKPQTQINQFSISSEVLERLKS